MENDLNLIKKMEKKFGKELRKAKMNDLENEVDNSFVPDESDNVIGLNLSRIKSIFISQIIFAFANLKKLSLKNINIKNLNFLKELQYLSHLNLRNIKINDFNALEELTNLKSLDLGNNQIKDATFIKALKNLDTLDLSLNELRDLTCIKDLNRLRKLYLSHNQISDLSFLHSFEDLTLLDLRYNQISDVSALLNLKNLTDLDLRDNMIHELPSNFIDMEMEVKWEWDPMGGIFLEGNPLESPPIEIVKKGKKAIKAYFESVPKSHLNEVKVLLVGDGGAGKTSFAKRLLGYEINKDEPKTHGININSWYIKEDDEKIKINLWDFGGQEIMHATHQFFLSKRSLYILILDGRKNEDPEYWLQHIESFSGDSPVLVVINKIDQNPGFEVNRKVLMEKYQNLKGFYRISCWTCEGIAEFILALNKQITKIPHIHTPWPNSWFNVKERLERMNDDFISYDEYTKICQNENIISEESQHILVDFLNDLGVVLHFNEPCLMETNVIDPEWATTAVYTIINSQFLAENKGILPKSALNKILNKHLYPRRKQDFIIELMKKFELCFSFEQTSILVPDLLGVVEPEFPFDYTGAFKFLIQYDFLPKSVIARFIVRMHRDIKNDWCWRTGVVVEDPLFGCTAVVKVDEREKKLMVFVSGSQIRDYFSVIRKKLQEINSSFEKIDDQEMVPCNCSECIRLKNPYFHEYAFLYKSLQKGKPTVTCKKSIEDIPIESLLTGINIDTRNKPQWDVFISYSSKDSPIIKEICEDLKANGISCWLDTEQILPGDFITGSIEDGLQNSRFLLACISKNQIKSGWSLAELRSVMNGIFSGSSKQKLLPLILDDLNTQSLPYLMRDINWIQYTNKESYKVMLRRLKKL